MGDISRRRCQPYLVWCCYYLSTGTGPLLRERVLRRRKPEGRNAVGKDPSELTYPRIGWPAAAAPVALFLRRRVRVIGPEKMQ